MLDYIYKKIHSISHEQTHNENSIGGWLYLVAVGLGYVLMLELKAVYSTIALLFDSTLRAASSIPWARLSLCFEIGVHTLIALWVGYLIVLMYSKDKRFPQYYSIMYILLFAVTLIEILIIRLIPYQNTFMRDAFFLSLKGLYTQVIVIVIAGLVLGTYVKISKRSKRTFVH